jgi:fumarate reductase flavoprotein subunit
VAALELAFMLDVATAMLNAAVRREESRGAHQRTDFPARDDRRFLAHSLTYRGEDGTPRVEYPPVTITRWPPGERVYGEAAPHGEAHQAAGRAVSSGTGF